MHEQKCIVTGADIASGVHNTTGGSHGIQISTASLDGIPQDVSNYPVFASLAPPNKEIMNVIATLMNKLHTSEGSRALSVIYDSSSPYSKVYTVKYYLSNCCPIQINSVNKLKPKNGICKCVLIP